MSVSSVSAARYRVSCPHFRLIFAAATSLGLLLMLAAPAAHAATWYVRPAGGGEATTIQGGLALAQSGDIVLVAAGTYMEHDLQLPPGVGLISESGRDATIIDAQGLGHGVIGADGSVVRGFTIQHADRHAVYCYQTSPAVLDNRFVDNYEQTIVLYRSASEIAGNEFFAYPLRRSSHLISTQSTPWVHDNVFHADDPNGNISAIEMSDVGPGGIGAPRIENNVIYGRTFISYLIRDDTTHVTGNVCVIQNGFSEVFNIAFNPSPLLIGNNTMVGGSGVFLQGDSKAALLGNIVVDGRYGIQVWSGEVVLDCNDIFHCQTSYAGVSPGPHDFSADPLFCSSAAGDYHLHDTSPCTPALAPDGCGLVGAMPVACTGVNRGPTASAGGPYSALAGFPLMFDGIASSDPDGDVLTYAWDFGDGKTGSGATPVHTYTTGGTFNATLRVTDPGGLFGDAATTVTIRSVVSADVLLENGGSTLDVRRTGNRSTRVGLEEMVLPYTHLVPSTIRISTNFTNSGFVTECPPDLRSFVIGDLNGNGVPDIDVRFSNKCLANLFNNVPDNTLATVVITGQFSESGSIVQLSAQRDLTIRAKHRDEQIMLVASPNPFNPETVIEYTVMSAGAVTLTIYGVDGRLVRTLKQGEETVAGTYDVRWNATDDNGHHVSSGIYLLKVTQKAGAAEKSSALKLVVTK